MEELPWQSTDTEPGRGGRLSPPLPTRESDSVPEGAPGQTPLRVLHVINSLGLGGTERGVLKIMEGLDPARFDQRVCAIHGAGPELASQPAFRGKVVTVDEGEKAGFEFLVPRLAKIIRKACPHIVHSRNWGGIEAVFAAKLAGTPVVIHSEHGYELDMLEGLPLRRRLMRRGMYAMCDAVFTVSRELQGYHRRQAWTSAKRIRVLPNGVDTNVFAPNAVVRERVRGRLGLAPDCVVLGAVGRLVPIKAHGTLLRAAEQFIRRSLDVHVLVVGGGPELERLRAYVSQSKGLQGRATFAGASVAVDELYQAMDVFVLPSIREGMSNTLLEAMASGLPCVASNVGSNSELVADGRWGHLFPAEDVDGLVRSLEQLVQQTALREQFGLAARRQAVEAYGLDRMVKTYAELYFELARTKGLTQRN